MEKHGYASEEAVRTCMGVRPYRRHASVRPRYTPIKSESVRSDRYSSVHRDRYAIAIEELEKEITELSQSREIVGISQQMDQASKLHSSLSSLACIVSSPGAIEVEDMNEGALFDSQGYNSTRTTRRKRQSKLSSSLLSLGCIVGGQKTLDDTVVQEDTQEDTDELTDDDSHEGQDWFAEEDEIKTQTKTVKFLHDIVDEPVTDSAQYQRNASRDLVLSDGHDQLQRDVAELQSELAELQLLNCLDDVEAWLGIHRGSLQKVIKHGMTEHNEGGPQEFSEDGPQEV